MKILGALAGGAMGDALGATVEFMDAETIKKQGRHTEIIGGGWLNLKPGEVTDDTQMTMAVARGILKNPDKPIPEIGREFIAWYRSEPKDIGTTCAASIGQAKMNGGDWERAAEYTHTHHGGSTAGNGALMRCIYPALYYKNDAKAELVAAEQSNMTHFDKQSMDACVLYCRIIRRFLTEPAGNARSRGRMIIYDETIGTPYASGNLWTRDDINPTGYVVDSMKAAIWAFLKARSFEETLIRAVNLGGDADTIGAIAGGLAGSWYGDDEIPERWTKAMDPKTMEELIDLAYEAMKNRGGDTL